MTDVIITDQNCTLKIMPQNNNHNLNCLSVIQSTIPNSHLGIQPCMALQPNGKWHPLGYYSFNKTKASDININFNGALLKLLSYEQHERCLDHTSYWLQIADDRNATIGQSGIDFGSLAQDSKYPNAILESMKDDEISTLWVEASDDSNNEIFVRYISDESDLRGVKFASAYPPTARELRLYSAWLESHAFCAEHDLKLLTDYNSKQTIQAAYSEAVRNDPQQLLPKLLMHTKLRTLVQDTTLRMYLELKYEDRPDILEKLRFIDQNGTWQPYYVHDQDCVTRIKAIPNYKSLILNEQWDGLRTLVLKIHFANHQLLLQDLQTQNNKLSRLSELSVFKEQHTGARLTPQVASDINALLQDPDFFQCTYAEKTAITLLNMLCTRIHFIDPEYANNAAKMRNVIRYLAATERDIQVSLTNRYASDAYSPALIDLLITRVDALANSPLGIENTECLQAIKDGFNHSKALMQRNNHQSHPMSEKYANTLAYYCCQDIPCEQKREYILYLQINYAIVSEIELSQRLTAHGQKRQLK